MTSEKLNSRFDSSIPVINVEGLTVYRGRYAAVENVSFQLMPGTSSAIVGPNGSGKSTLVQAILDLIPSAKGSVQIFGRPIRKLGKLRHEIGYMPQNFIFDRSFPISVTELVGLGWIKTVDRTGDRMHYTKLQAIAQALGRVSATHLRHQAIGTLSGGELKRVLLAYCLVMPRRLLILDEAFAEVDVQGEADFYSLLDELRREEGWTVLQVSHDLDMVSRRCDQVLCLNRSLVCSGQPEIALSPQNLLETYGPDFSRYRHQH
jgi:zinc transport system ATP-binding protein